MHTEYALAGNDVDIVATIVVDAVPRGKRDAVTVFATAAAVDAEHVAAGSNLTARTDAKFKPLPVTVTEGDEKDAAITRGE